MSASEDDRPSDDPTLDIESFCDICWGIHRAGTFENNKTEGGHSMRCVAKLPTPSANASCASCRFFASFVGYQRLRNQVEPNWYILYEISYLWYLHLDCLPVTKATPRQIPSFWILLPDLMTSDDTRYHHKNFQVVRSLLRSGDPGCTDTARIIFALRNILAETVKGLTPDATLVRNVATRRGLISRKISTSHITNQVQYRYWGLPRVLEPAMIDYEVLKDWLKRCGECHTLSSASKSSTLPLSFAVIDCMNDKIGSLPDGESFIALSYVWGPPTSMTVQETPLVVQDAKKVTLKLGFRYLWVDRYCISTEASVKHEQIMNMDLVYQCAYATIIAAAGENPSFGLPGVSRRQRTKQPRIKIGHGALASIASYTLVSTLPDPRISIRESKWASRAWTYQEFYLSQRRIFFTTEQIYFECHAKRYGEAMKGEFNNSIKADGTPLYPSRFKDVSLGKSFTRSPGEIWDRIAEYTQRSMTYESDALNGLLGLLRSYRKLDNPVYHIWGLPIFELYNRRSFRHDEERSMFIISLCWHVSSPSIRRNEFPSWSWTGWKGQVDNRHVSSLVAGIFKPCDDLRLELEIFDGKRLSWDKVLQRVKSDGMIHTPFGNLHIYSRTFEIRFQRDGDGQWRACIEPQSHHVGSSLYLCKSESEDEPFRTRLEKNAFVGIVLGLEESRLGDCKEHVLLIVDEEGQERIGFLRWRLTELSQIRQTKKWTVIR